MRILGINGGASGSSWDLCSSILINAKNRGHDVFVATPDKEPENNVINYFRIGNSFLRTINKFITRIDGSDGFRNVLNTKRLIQYIEKIKPDVIHLHTLHGYFINIKLLLNYIKVHKIRLIITCHDCWWFTGRCSHFYYNGCDKWKTECANCKYKSVYPRSFLFDKSKKFHSLKKELFEDFENLTIVCVSDWLSRLCSMSSIFHNKNIITIHNGLDESKYVTDFEPSKNEKSFISVASQWNETKGIDIIINLAKLLPDYRFLLVGNMSYKNIPNNIRNVGYVSNKKDLALLYKQNGALLNASRQETFSLVNVEAQMCGIPVICFAETGMKETIADNSFAVSEYSVSGFLKQIMAFEKEQIDVCRLQEFSKKFSLQNMNKGYLNIYLNNDGGLRNE